MSRGGPGPGDDVVRGQLERAHRDMDEYQAELARDADVAEVKLGGLPQVLVPTRVVARDLPRVLAELISVEATGVVLYQLGYLIAAAHAEQFFADRGIDDDEHLYRALTGTFHFAWVGYGDVDILLLEPHADERFVTLWETANSFSAREAIAAGDRRRVCYTQAGYSAGWLSRAVGIPLEARELACQTEGVHSCRFLVAHESRMRHLMSEARFHQRRESYSIIPARLPRAEEPGEKRRLRPIR